MGTGLRVAGVDLLPATASRNVSRSRTSGRTLPHSLPLPPVSRHSNWFARTGATIGWWAAVVMLCAGGGAGGGCTTWAPLVGLVDEPVDVARDTGSTWSPHPLVRHNLWFEQAVPCDAPRAVRARSARAEGEALRADELSDAPTDVAR